MLEVIYTTLNNQSLLYLILILSFLEVDGSLQDFQNSWILPSNVSVPYNFKPLVRITDFAYNGQNYIRPFSVC